MLTTGHSLTARGLSAQRGSLWPSRHRHFTRIPSGPPRPTASALLCPFHRWGHGLGWASVGFRPSAGEEEQESWGDLAMHPAPSLGGFRRSGLQCPRTAGRSHQSQVHTRAWEAEGAGVPTPAPAIHPGWHLHRGARAPCGLPRTGDTRQGRCHDLSSDGPHLLWTKGTSVGPRAPQEKPQGPNSLSRVGYTAV